MYFFHKVLLKKKTTDLVQTENRETDEKRTRL